MMHVEDDELEPSRAARLVAGEQVLWEGAPRWQSLAVVAFHARKIALYFALLIAWALAAPYVTGGSVSTQAATAGATWLAALGIAAVGLAMLLAWLNARATTYRVTNYRVLMRFGVALPMTVFLPLAKIEGASVRKFRDGTGDIPIALPPGNRLAYLVLWPHARPWRFSRPEPMLRCVAEPERVANILSAALARTADGAASRVPMRAPAPATGHEVGGPTAAAA